MNENQSRDVDWSKDDKPVKFGDDAVAEENYCWWLGRPTISRLRVKMTVQHGKNPTFPFFIWLNNNYKGHLDLKIFCSIFYDSSLRLLRSD